MNLNNSIVKNYRFLKQFLKQNKPLILPSFFIIFIGQLVTAYTFWEIEKGLIDLKKMKTKNYLNINKQSIISY